MPTDFGYALRDAFRRAKEKNEQGDQRRSDRGEQTDAPVSDPRASFAHVESKAQASPGKKKRRRDLIVGLDFGTSSIKAIIRDPILEKAFAIPLVPECEGMGSYLLPTAFVITGSGAWAPMQSEGAAVANPKADLLDAIKAESSLEKRRIEAAMSVAHGLRRTREVFDTRYGDQYSEFDVVWEVNVGAPMRGSGNETVRREFLMLGRVAYVMAFDNPSAPLTCEAIARALGEVQAINHLLVHVRAEVVAEVHGYRQSPQRLDGLHALIDIGATTVDVCTFIIGRKDGEEWLGILAAEISELGVHVVENERVNHALEALSSMHGRLDSYDPLRAPFDVVEFGNFFADASEESDRVMAGKMTRQFVGLIRYTKENRDPLSKRWEEGVRLFVCGGGKSLPCYAGQISRIVDQGLGRQITLHGQEIPKPADLYMSGGSYAHFDRLAVAYGLSFRQLDFGEIKLPEAIPDSNVVAQNGRDVFDSTKEASGD